MKSDFKPLLQQLLDIQAYTGSGSVGTRLTMDGVYCYAFCVVFMMLLFTYITYRILFRKTRAEQYQHQPF